jgi:hypothetical protein
VPELPVHPLGRFAATTTPAASRAEGVKGLGYGLDENALAALEAWRFAPALRNGLPVSAVAEIEIHFNIANEKLRQVHLELQRMHQDLERVRQNLEQAIRLPDQLKQTGGQK